MKDLFSYILEKGMSLKDEKLADPKSPNELMESFDLNLESKAYSKNPKEIVDAIFKNSVNTQNPRFLNQLYGGSTQESWVGEMLVSILNTSMATYEIAPLATLMEKELISGVNEAVGFSAVEGIMAPGGSYANMLGVQCARHAKNPDLKENGMYESSKYKVFVSKAAHYSSEKSLVLMGLGTSSLVLVDIDEDKKMKVESLKSAVKACIADGDIPLCVVSTAGTTVWGSFDPIEETDKICKEFDIWHHVDAAWGGLALWSPHKNKLFKGLEEVDSLTIDFHKLFASTLTKGMFLTSRKNVLRGANSGGGTKYIFHNDDEEAVNYDTGTYAIQCGRKVDSLPVWFQWKMGGTEQFVNKASELYELASWAVEFVSNKPAEYKLLLSPEYMNICFQILPGDDKIDVGEFNRKVRARLMERGNFMVNFSSTEKDGAFFRLVLSHWGLKQAVLEEFFKELEDIKEELKA
ncbi:MAG: pyridoxal phosphate-dependent decarboxylase family protein [Bdellovibrionales bacterium]